MLEIVTDPLLGAAIEKAIAIIGGKLQNTDLEVAAKVIKKVVGDYFEPDGNDYHNALKTWNKDVIQKCSDLTFCLEEEGIYQSIKRFQEGQGFTKISENGPNRMRNIIIPENNLRETSRILCMRVREKAQSDKHLKFVAEQFDAAFEREYQNAYQEKTQKLLENISKTMGRFLIQDDNVAYYHEFRSPLFLEQKRKYRITLENMYCSPVVNAENGASSSAADIINDWFFNDTNHSVLLLFGNAGVGKSSLCRKIVRDAIVSNAENREFMIPLQKLHVIPLRDKTEELETWDAGKSIKKLLKKLFNISDWPTEDELFVLDGLDEVEVLCPKFPIDSFLSNLHSFSECGLKLLITSRKTDRIEEYGIIERENDRLKHFTLSWTKNIVHEWCNKYKYYQRDLPFDGWVKEFFEFYDNLPDDDPEDERRKIWQTPVILYIVCYSRIKLTKESTIGTIYDEAFRKLLDREHISNATAHDVFDETLERQVQWQFTKELAFQMFLHKSLTLSDAEQPAAIENAKRRTIAILKQKNVQIEDQYPFDIKAYFALFHFARENSDKTGIIFAHKTVYEYFTAVKLYEDYLKMSDSDLDSIDQVWDKLIGAFMYKYINSDVMDHLVMLHKQDQQAFSKLSLHFYKGICNQLIISKPFQISIVSEYALPQLQWPPTIQLQILFCNLTHFFTHRGYQNKFYPSRNQNNFVNCLRVLLSLPQLTDIGSISQLFCLETWQLPECYFNRAIITRTSLKEANLKGAHLEGAILERVNLEGAILESANLEGAYLESANLEGAILESANLEGAYLERAHLEDAYLERAHLEGAYLEGAFYNESTVFSDGFDPDAHGMIKVPEYRIIH